MKVIFLFIYAKTALHRPPQTCRARKYASDLYKLTILPVLGLDVKLEIDYIRVSEYWPSSNVAFVQDFFHLEKRVKALIKTTRTFIEKLSIRSWSQALVNELLAFETCLSIFRRVVTDTRKNLILRVNVLDKRVGFLPTNKFLNPIAPFPTNSLHILWTIIAKWY